MPLRLSILSVFVIFFNPLFSQMTGSYTIGTGSANDFSHISQAVDSLKSAGYTGNLIFNIDTGSYTDSIVISGFQTANSTITFRKNPLQSGKVSLSAITASSAPLLVMDSCRQISFENIEYINQNTIAGRIVVIQNYSENIIFRGCHFRGSPVSSTSLTYCLAFSPNTIDNNLFFDSCFFYNGSFGIYFNGAVYEDSNNIRKCSFINQYAAGISFINQRNFELTENSISTHSTYQEIEGIIVENAYPNCRISENKINIEGEGFPLLITTSFGSPTNHLKVYNNFFHAGGYSLACGIFIESCKYIDVGYNNILISKSTTGSAGRAINIQASSVNTSNLYFYNNNMVNKGTGFGFCTFATDSIFCDYNNYFTPKGVVGYWNGYYAGSLNSWIFYSGGQGTHSIYHDPKYYSTTDLHVSSFWVDSAATPLSYVQSDIDKTIRNSQYPDMGADEINIYPYDIGFIEITSPVNYCPNSVFEIKARLKNFGKINISTAVLQLFLNDTLAKTLNFSGNLQANQDTLISFGNQYFGLSSSYKISVNSSLPNSFADQNTANDSTTSQIMPGISGQLTLGQNKDFTSLTQAVGFVAERGLCGPLEILIDSGEYNGNFIIPEIPGASATSVFTLKGKGDAAVKILADNTKWYNDYALNITGSHIRLENLVVENKSSGTGANLLISGNISDLIFKKIVFSGYDSALAMITIAPEDSGISNLLFDSCHFLNGIYGISYPASSLGDPLLHRIEIRNCSFLRQAMQSVRLGKANNIWIEDNFIKTSATYPGFTAIRLDYSGDSVAVLANTIQINKTGTGIYVYNNQSNAVNKVIIANNAIYCGGGTAAAYGISLNYALNCNIYHNSIRIDNPNTFSRALYIGSYSSQINVFNNILVCTSKGYCFYSTPTSGIFTDYNNLFTTSGILGYWSGNRSSLQQWQSVTKMDSHSVSVNPVFRSKYDLHVRAKALDSAGFSLAVVPFDMDHELRNPNYPDIGADEFELFDYDVVLEGTPVLSSKQCDGSILIDLKIQNNGILHVDSMQATLNINDSDHYYSIYTSLNYLEEAVIPVAFYDFIADSHYRVKALLSLPNGHADRDTFNNIMILDSLPLIPTPTLTEVRDDTICFGTNARLFASGNHAQYFHWYDSATLNQYPTGDSVFSLSRLYSSKTLFVEAGSEHKPDSLLTAFANVPGNITNGNMFDIKAKSTALYIDSFDVHTFYANRYTFYIYYRTGTFRGYEGDSNSWIVADTVELEATGPMKPTRVALSRSVFIPAGQTYGFYITAPGFSYLKYSGGTSDFENSDIKADNGIALDYLFDDTYSVPATWNGNIYYSTGSYCVSPKEAVHAVVADTPAIQLPADSFICQGSSLRLQAVSGKGFTYEWNSLPHFNILSEKRSLTIDSAQFIQLIIADACGFSDMKIIDIGERPSPDALFTLDSTIQCATNNLFSPINKSQISQGNLTFTWWVNDSLVADTVNPDISLNGDGIKELSLIAYSEYNCPDSFSQSIELLPAPVAGFTLNPKVQCLNENSFDFINISHISKGTMQYTWNTGQGNILHDTSLMSFHYILADTYDISLTVFSDWGCRDSIESTVIVKPSPGVFLGNDTIICGGSNLLLVPGFNYDSYLWSNDSTDAVIRVDSNGTGFGTVNYWVEVIKDGCPARDTIAVRFYNCLSILDISPDAKILLYPNPAGDYLHINYLPANIDLQNIEIRITDLEGHIVDHYYNSTGSGMMPIQHLAKGIYNMVIITGQGKIQTIKFIKN